MINTERLNIVEATEDDIDIIMEIEHHKENRDFIWMGTYEEHKNEIEDPNHFLWVFKSKDNGKIVGFALARVNRKSDVFELRRIAIKEKGIGYGKEAIKAIMKFAFEDFGANRFWLDVYPHNTKGIRLYESLGMKRDGILRQNYKSEHGYLDQIIYSILKHEYFNCNNDEKIED